MRSEQEIRDAIETARQCKENSAEACYHRYINDKIEVLEWVLE